MFTKIKVGDQLAVDPIFYDDRLIIICNDPDSGLYVGWRTGRNSCQESTVLGNIRKRLRVYETDLVIACGASNAAEHMWDDIILWPYKVMKTKKKFHVGCFPCSVTHVSGLTCEPSMWLSNLDKE